MNNRIKAFLEHSNLIENVGIEGWGDTVKAYNYTMQIKPPLTEKHILKIHRLLLKSLNPRIAGNFRTCLVRVGGRICPLVSEIKPKLKKFYFLINKKQKNFTTEEKENYCKLMHINFEKIHPFEDGNGRTGRLVYQWQRKQLGLSIKIIYYSERQAYYDWFL